MNIQMIDHACLKVKASKKVIYFDPYNIPKNEEKADIIVVSHNHPDHFDRKSVKHVLKGSTQIVCPATCMKIISSFNAKGLNPGESIDFENINVKAVPAYTTIKKTHPREKQWLGYIVSDGKTSIYHAGDTEIMPEMENFTGIDYALLPVGGTYTMDFNEALDAAKRIKPNKIIPIHTWNKDISKFEKMMNETLPDIEVIILNPGEFLEK